MLFFISQSSQSTRLFDFYAWDDLEVDESVIDEKIRLFGIQYGQDYAKFNMDEFVFDENDDEENIPDEELDSSDFIPKIQPFFGYKRGNLSVYIMRMNSFIDEQLLILTNYGWVCIENDKFNLKFDPFIIHYLP